MMQSALMFYFLQTRHEENVRMGQSTCGYACTENGKSVSMGQSACQVLFDFQFSFSPDRANWKMAEQNQ